MVFMFLGMGSVLVEIVGKVSFILCIRYFCNFHFI
jgi:hypothetical protein